MVAGEVEGEVGGGLEGEDCCFGEVEGLREGG